MSEDKPKLILYDYLIRFERLENTYRLLHYNTPWEDDRELEDIRIIFEGKDLNNNDFSAYKAVKWENLERGIWDVSLLVNFVLNADGKTYDQHFNLKELKKVTKDEQG
jgi:hypothetical protein